ncbi:hypothetical protein C366_04885 [Cryptococcus neoformans Tu401-1]|nr:hypothetical protein AYX15_04522 [Cryptococcus neoformans var. grubii]OXG14316.1 hypothetical protein C366_04885 [Cryptococcus neoformans var. grubii Tu401-1]OXM77316.1 hypothetical protein C364_04872 [Cryptococcus neoformans var. grubii Bt63]
MSDVSTAVTTITSSAYTDDISDDFGKKWVWLMVGAIIFIIVFGLMFAICRKYHKRGRMTVWGRNPHCRNCGEKIPEKLGATQGLEKLWCWKVKTYYCDACDRNGRKNGIV